MWSFVAYFVSGIAYRRRILSFWQTSSRLVRLPVVYWMSVILYTCRNHSSALSVGVPDAFLRDYFNVSTKRSARPFDLE